MTNDTAPARSNKPTPADRDPLPGADLAAVVGWRLSAVRVAAAITGGLLLSAAFPPLEWGWCAWVGLIPMLAVPQPPTLWRRALLGYLFGLAHFASNLLWLNTIGFAAGFLLALVCALFPMLWYLFTVSLAAALDNRPAEQRRPPEPTLMLESPWRRVAIMLLAAAAWTTLEWVRGWLFTGFPWNQLAISQWNRPALLALTRWTGVYGVSFLIAAANVALYDTGRRWYRSLRRGRRHRVPLPLITLVVLTLPVFLAALTQPPLPQPSEHLAVLAVQGNIPQCREWTEASFREALEVYSGLTRSMAPALDPELVVWPESAVPAPLSYPDYWEVMKDLPEAVDTPILLGTIRYQAVPRLEDDDTPTQTRSYNTATLLGSAGTVINRYDKVHLVPFGEYTPFEDYLPWLVEWIGMGRSLSAGSAYVVMDMPEGARTGINICFEDAFPDISRQFAKRGANVLMTLTNDAWYAESAGSRQHLLHAVFRAAENRRPILRSGNNSDTCLITANGQIRDLLRDAETGNPFVRAAAVYQVPVRDNLPLTFYTRYGDVFAIACTLATALAAVILSTRFVHRKRTLLETILGTPL